MANPTILLSTFDDSLAFSDASGSGVWTEVDPLRYLAIGSQNGVWVEKAAINLVVNPTAVTNTDGWTVGGGGTLTLNQETDLPAPLPGWLADQVTTGFRVNCVTTDTAFSTMSIFPTLTAATYTAGAYYYIPTAFTGAAPRLMQNNFTSATGDSTVSANMSLRDQWQFLEITFTPDAGDLSGALRVQMANPINEDDFFYFAAVQLELGAYPTSFSLNSLGDGYSGTTTHIRAASSVSVDQDTVARIDPASGSIAFRYKRLIDTAAEETILTCGTVGSGTDYLEIGVDTSDDLYMEWNSDNAGAERVTIATTIAVDTDYFFYFDWDGTTIRASIDNGSLSSDTRAAAEGDWSTGDLTLSAAVGSHVVGPFLVADRPLTSKEIATLNARSTWGFSTLRGGNRYNIFQLRPKAA